MKFELWHSEAEGSYMLLVAGDPQQKPHDARVLWTVEAVTFEAALQLRNRFLAWGEYQPGTIPFDYPPAKR